MNRAADTLIACCLSTFCVGRTTEYFTIVASMNQAKPEAQAPKRAITVADSIQMTRFGDPSYTDGGPAKGIVAKFSPNGEQFVVVLKRGNLEDNTNEYSLVLFRTSEAFHSPTPRAVVSMSSSSNRPAIHNVVWLNDNDTILFLGEHPGEPTGLYSLKCGSGDLKRLTNHPANLTAFASTAKGDRVVYVAETPVSNFVTEDALRNGIYVSHENLSDLIKGSFGGEYSDHKLFVEELGDKKEIQAHIEGQIQVDEVEPSLSPDGKYFVVQTEARETPLEWSDYEDKWLRISIHSASSPGAATGVYQYELVDTHTGTSQVLLDAPIPPNLGSEVAWSPDGQSVVVSDAYLPLTVDDPAEQTLRKSRTFLVEIKLPSREIIKISDQDLRLVKWDPRTNTVVCEAGRIDSLRGKTMPTMYFRKKGDKWFQVEAPEETVATRPVIVLEEDLNAPPRIVAVDSATGQKSLLMDLNPQFGHLALAKVEEVKWKDTLGNEVTGGLYWPPNYISGSKYPLVIQTHGFEPDRFWIDGPWTTAFAAQPLAGKNFFVLQIPDPDWQKLRGPSRPMRVPSITWIAEGLLTGISWELSDSAAPVTT
jgi:dipeptidyl aminopeptidase/acylaminoacyl peptidase